MMQVYKNTDQLDLLHKDRVFDLFDFVNGPAPRRTLFELMRSSFGTHSFFKLSCVYVLHSLVYINKKVTRNQSSVRFGYI